MAGSSSSSSAPDSGNKFRKTSSSSPSSIRNLNKTLDLDKEDFTDDIWSEICLHLPIKSIYKFRCVSKVWQSLLSEPNFINKWIQINTPSPWILFYSTTQNRLMFTYLDLHSELFSDHDGFSLKFLNQNLVILGASNGLVLSSRNMRSFYVCNPLTKQWVLLPPPPTPPSIRLGLSALVCDCFSSQASASYRVVRIPHFAGESNKFNIEIFSSELGIWNVYQLLCPQVVTWEFSVFSSALIINQGILYWIEGKNKLMAYNLNETSNSSTCRLIDLPDHGEVGNIPRHAVRGEMTFTKIPYRCLGEAEGLVCFARIDMWRTLSVWVLEGEKWHVLRKDIVLRDIVNEIQIKLRSYLENTQVPPIEFDVRLTQLLGFNPVDRNVVILGIQNYVWAYNIRTGTYEELCPPFTVCNNIVPSENKRTHMYLPFVLKPMPTILPPPSWTVPPMVQVQHEPSAPEL